VKLPKIGFESLFLIKVLWGIRPDDQSFFFFLVVESGAKILILDDLDKSIGIQNKKQIKKETSPNSF